MAEREQQGRNYEVKSMKQNWTYKKLGEVCTIERGGSPRPINDYITDAPNGLNWIKIGDAVEGSKYISSTKEKIKPEGLKKTRLVHKGDFILSNSMSFGKPYILEIDGCIHDGWLVIHDNNGTFDKSFLYYLLRSPNMYMEFQRLAVGGVVNNLNSEIVRNVVVPVPPLAIQSRIVSELDLLQSLIDKQKAQLKELDTLAQSIFYDMFGDPVENEKGWDVKKLGNMCEVTSSKRVYQSEWKTIGVPFYRISDFSQLVENVQFNSELYISMDKYDELKRNNQVPVAGDILVTSRGTLGNCYIVKNDDCFYFQDGMITWLKNINNRLHPLFLTFLFKNSSFRKQIEKNQSGSTVAYLSISMLKKFALPVPPLSFQQSFAAKIESIEKQKAAISKSIAETEKLFEYTMDKYFG